MELNFSLMRSSQFFIGSVLETSSCACACSGPSSSPSSTDGSARSPVTSTAITKSAPMRVAMFTGSGLTNPPSTSSSSPRATGVNIAGMAMLARTASMRLPSSSMTSLPVRTSVATAANGMGRSRMSDCIEYSFTNSTMRVPSMRPMRGNDSSVK